MAGIVVSIELIAISLIRKRFLSVPLRTSLLQVALGGALIAAGHLSTVIEATPESAAFVETNEQLSASTA